WAPRSSTAITGRGGAGATRSIRSTGAVTRRCGPCGKSIPSTAWSLPEAVSPEPVQAACPLELRQRDLIDVSHERIDTLARRARQNPMRGRVLVSGGGRNPSLEPIEGAPPIAQRFEPRDVG